MRARPDHDSIDDQREDEQHEPECKGALDLPTTRLRHDGSRQDTRTALEISPDDHRRANFRDDGPERRHHGNEEAEPCLTREQPERTQPAGAKDTQQIEDPLGKRLKGCGGEADHDGSGDQELSEHHRLRRVDQFEGAKRAASNEQQPHDEPDHHRRHAHTRVDEAEQDRIAREAAARQHVSERDADRYRQCRSRPGDRQGPQCDRQRGSIHSGVAPQSRPEGSASGKNSDSPYRSRPKAEIACWIGTDVRKSMSSLASANLTQACFTWLTA